MSASSDNEDAKCARSLLRHIEMATPLRDGFRAPVFALGEKAEWAAMIAARAHRDQYRAKLEAESIPYIDHVAKVSALVCRNVMLVAKEIGPEDLICAAILHDAYEDFADVREVAHESFSEQVVALLEAQRKVSSRDFPDRSDRDRILAEKIEIFGPPAILVKLCDLIDNVNSSPMAPAHLRDRLLGRVRDLYIPMGFRHDQFYYLTKRLEGAVQETEEYRIAGEDRIDFAERVLNIMGQRAPDWHDFFENLSYAAGFSQYEIVPEEDIAAFCRRYGLSTLDIRIGPAPRNPAVAMQKIIVKSKLFFKKDRLIILIRSAVVDRYVGNVVFLIGFIDTPLQDNVPTSSTMALLIDYINLKIQS